MRRTATGQNNRTTWSGSFNGRYQGLHEAPAEAAVAAWIAEVHDGATQQVVSRHISFFCPIDPRGDDRRRKGRGEGSARLDAPIGLARIGKREVHARGGEVDVVPAVGAPEKLPVLVDSSDGDDGLVGRRKSWGRLRAAIPGGSHEYHALARDVEHDVADNGVVVACEAQIDDPHIAAGQNVQGLDEIIAVGGIAAIRATVKGIDSHQFCGRQQARVVLRAIANEERGDGGAVPLG